MDFDLKFLLKFSACVMTGFLLAVYYPQIQGKFAELETQKAISENKPKTPEPTSKYPKLLPDPNISLPEENKPSDESQAKGMGYVLINAKDYAYECPDMKTVIAHIVDGGVKNVYALQSNDDHKAEILYRDSAMKPFYNLSPAYNYMLMLNKHDLDTMGPDMTINLSEYLVDQGFKIRGENNSADIYYDYSLSSFEKDGWIYTIKLGASIGVELACAPNSTIEQQSVKDFDAIVAAAATTATPFSPFTIIEQWGYKDNVYELNTFRMFSNGHAEYWAKVQDTWKLLSSTQDLPTCEPFVQNKVGKGTKCYTCIKGYNPTDQSCQETAETTVSY